MRRASRRRAMRDPGSRSSARDHASRAAGTSPLLDAFVRAGFRRGYKGLEFESHG